LPLLAMAAVAEAVAEAAADLGECAELGSVLPPIFCYIRFLCLVQLHFSVAFVAAIRYWLIVK
jgi:hypothetical protein